MDLRGLMLLRQGNLDMAYFPKDDKFNVAILESELVRYEQLIQQREQSREPEETRRECVQVGHIGKEIVP